MDDESIPTTSKSEIEGLIMHIPDHRERPFRAIVNTDSGDREHQFRTIVNTFPIRPEFQTRLNR